VNIAYTSLALELHQDLVYYESPPGLQLLHCREFAENIVGGEHLLLDGFAVAERLRSEHPLAFATLVRIPAAFQKVHAARASPAHMTYSRPHISLNGR
jgi:gamma-butyrobetaine dioxygenase